MTSASALTVTALCKVFGGLKAVDSVALSVSRVNAGRSSEPNGAGKTTLFNLISGDLPPTSGRISLFGRDVTHLPPHRAPPWASPARTRSPTSSRASPCWRICSLAVQALERTKLVLLRPVTSYAHLYRTARATLESVGLGDKEAEVVEKTSPMASSGRWRSPWPWRVGRGFCFSTSRPPGSPPPKTRMMTDLLKRLNSGSRSSSSSTTWTWRSP